MRSIVQSVGDGGVNHADDVFTVQMLLNHVDHASGGPSPALDVDGLVGPLTIGAIHAFQQRNLGFSDGLVEPGRATLHALTGFFRDPDAFPSDLVAGVGAAPVPHRLVHRDVRCRERLSLANLPSLAPLHGAFAAGVDLLSCSVAFIGPGKGDGTVFLLPDGPDPRHVRARIDGHPVLPARLGRLRPGLRPVGGHRADLRSSWRRGQRRALPEVLAPARTRLPDQRPGHP